MVGFVNIAKTMKLLDELEISCEAQSAILSSFVLCFVYLLSIVFVSISIVSSEVDLISALSVSKFPTSAKCHLTH